MNGQTASEEANGRLELYLAQPVDRRAVYLGRAVAAFVALLVVTVAIASGPVRHRRARRPADRAHLPDRDDRAVRTARGTPRRAGSRDRRATARPSLVLGAGIGVAIAGYLVAALLPLSPALEPLHHLSPWDWAFGGDPLEHATDLWRYGALVVPAVVLTALGVAAVQRRDIATG